MYRKFTATHIFNGRQLLPAGQVLITKTDGTITDITAAENAGDGIEQLQGVLTPGFINAHCHLELSHLKGQIAQHTGLVNFVFAIITQRNAPEAAITHAITNAAAAMWQNGIVAVGDICNTAHTVLHKAQSPLQYHNFIEVTGFVPATAKNRFETAVALSRQFKPPYSINPHAPYSVSPALFELINKQPQNKLVTIHNQETPEEDKFFRTGTGDFLKLYEQLGIDLSFYKPSGKSSLQTILPYFSNTQTLLLVHDVTTTQEDIYAVETAVKNQQLAAAYYCLCPNANKYISNQLPNVGVLIKNNCPIVLGTDSLASNHQLCILEEIKTLQQHFPALSTTQLLTWATSNGAAALQMHNSLGSFAIGYKPGIVLIENTDDLRLTPATAAKRIL